ncbi:hypothetical protein ACFLTC_00375 [Chloroflexota bacterium]
MNRYLTLSLMAIAVLLLAIACGPSSPPADSPTPTTTPTPAPPDSLTPTIPPAPPTQQAATPVATPSAIPPTEPRPSATATPAPDPPTGGAANADVVYVRAIEAADGAWTFHVTVEHPDTGWEDYADGWDVLLPDGTVLKPDADSPFTRLLLHPHENEQPFTRSQSGIVVPSGVIEVRVRAHDLVDGFGGREVVVSLTTLSGEDFEVERRP